MSRATDPVFRQQCVNMRAEGISTRQIATCFGVSMRTVKVAIEIWYGHYGSMRQRSSIRKPANVDTPKLERAPRVRPFKRKQPAPRLGERRR